MHSEPRRPHHIHLDRYVETLDERLRQEVVRVRRAALPRRLNRLIRALKVRALAIVQGGTLALTAVAVIVAVGVAPSFDSAVVTESTTILAAPTVKTDAMVIMKAGDVEFAPNSETILAVEERGILR
jgi:hypothetical protein